MPLAPPPVSAHCQCCAAAVSRQRPECNTASFRGRAAVGYGRWSSHFRQPRRSRRGSRGGCGTHRAGGEASTESASLNPRLVFGRREPWNHRPVPRKKTPTPAPPQVGYADWRKHVAALLGREGISASVMLERDWRNLFISGLSPEQAAERAGVERYN